MCNETPDQILLLPLDHIDARDLRFSLGPPWLTSPRLAESVRRVGVLTPLQVMEAGPERFRIVSGFKRYRIAAQMGLDSVRTRCLKRTDDLALYRESLWENLGTREFLVAEKAVILRKLRQDFEVPEQEVIEEYLPMLGIRPDRFHLERYLRLSELPQAVQEKLEELRQEIALKIARWDPEDCRLFLEMVHEYRLGKNKQWQLFVLLDEIRDLLQMRSGPTSLLSFWSRSGAAAAHGDQGREPADRYKGVLRILRSMRYPTLVEAETRAARLRAALRIPPLLQLNLPEFFEGDRIQVQFQAESPRQFRDLAEKLVAIGSREELEELFGLI